MGAWLPEPLPEPTEWIIGRPATTAVDPADRVTLDDSINMAFLVVLEAMTRPNASRSSCTTSSGTRSPTHRRHRRPAPRRPAANSPLSARRRIRAGLSQSPGSQAPATATAQQASPTNSGHGQPADPRPPTIGSATSRQCPLFVGRPWWEISVGGLPLRAGWRAGQRSRWRSWGMLLCRCVGSATRG